MGEGFRRIMTAQNARLNAICPYFTMFPLEFPLKVLSNGTGPGGPVLDPFCGRGTTTMAARLRKMPSVSIDNHPLAAAITQAELVTVSPLTITEALDEILETEEICPAPQGQFWELAFHEDTLDAIVRVRSALLRDPLTPARVALRAIILGALHGPLTKTSPSHLSNQCPRTYAPKPAYAVNFWQERNLSPRVADIRSVVARRADRYYAHPLPEVSDSKVVLADSTDPATFKQIAHSSIGWVITSPPYYGMRTYIPDQWLRLWFLGGPDTVEYSQHGQITHDSPQSFIDQLSKV